MKPGKESTEHIRAWRAEVLGLVLVAIGLALLLLSRTQERMFAGVALVAIGAYVVTRTAAAYFDSRGSVKAAAARPPALKANPEI